MSVPQELSPNTCPPYRFLNDDWSFPGSSGSFWDALSRETTDRSRAAALIIGSGALPYMLAAIDTPDITLSDYYQDVNNFTEWRTGMLPEYNEWEEYEEAVRAQLNNEGRQQQMNEIGQVSSLGLRSDYGLNRGRAEVASITSVTGDIRLTAGEIGASLRERGKAVMFAYLTNAAAYLPGRTVELGAALRGLPWAERAIIVDTTVGLIPRIYRPDNYPGIGNPTVSIRSTPPARHKRFGR